MSCISVVSAEYQNRFVHEQVSETTHLDLCPKLLPSIPDISKVWTDNEAWCMGMVKIGH